MRRQWKAVAMIMLVGLLVAGPLGSINHAYAQNENATLDRLLNTAQTTNSNATKMYQQMTTHMDAMKKMPMTANEKEMMKMMGQMADTIKMLIDANKNLIDAVNQLKERH